MGPIRSAGDAKTDLKFVQIMRQYGITGLRRHQRLTGTPDITFRRERLVVFVG